MGRIRAAFASGRRGGGASRRAERAGRDPCPCRPGRRPRPRPPPPCPLHRSPSGTPRPGPVQPGATITAPSPPRKPRSPLRRRGISAPENDAGAQKHTPSRPQASGGAASDAGTNPFPLSVPTPSFGVPGIASGSCTTTSPPPGLLPIYQRAAEAYSLGPQGPSVLAAINQIETNFGELNHVTSSAGAIGWMQFMPVDLGQLRGGRERRRSPRSLRPRGRDLRRRLLPAGLGDAAGHGRRDLRLQPRRLVRLRGARERRLLRLPRRQLLRARAADRGPLLQPGEGLGREDPERLPERLRVRRRPLRSRPPRRLGAGRGRQARVPLRAQHEQGAAAPTAARSASTRPSGGATRSTATATAWSGTPASATRRRPSPGSPGRAAA